MLFLHDDGILPMLWRMKQGKFCLTSAVKELQYI